MTIEFLSNVRKGIRVEILVSDIDADLTEYNWTVSQKLGYPTNSKLGTLHSVVGKRMIGRALYSNEEFDHINRIKSDCRRENLRPASHAQNIANRDIQSNNTSQYRGVYYDKRSGFWDASITVDKKKTWLGYYDTSEEAGIAFNYAARNLLGEFAQYNDIHDWENRYPTKKSGVGKNSRNKSGYVGVYWHEDYKKWVALITKDGIDYRLGAFDNPQEAARARNKKAVELYGENARLSVIETPA